MQSSVLHPPSPLSKKHVKDSEKKDSRRRQPTAIILSAVFVWLFPFSEVEHLGETSSFQYGGSMPPITAVVDPLLDIVSLFLDTEDRRLLIQFSAFR